jgi:hypothetical protein
MLVYGAASLLHFVDNAVYLHEYPNLPAWLTSTDVYASWCAISAVGVLDYWLHRRVSRVMGLQRWLRLFGQISRFPKWSGPAT